MRRLLAALATLLLLTVGCGAGEDLGADATPTRTPTASPTSAPMAQTDRCSNDVYSLAYPAGWEVNTGEVLPYACQVFHPGEIELEAGTEIGFAYAVTVRLEDQPFERVALDADDPSVEIIDQRSTEVDGHQAKVAEAQATDEVGLIPVGERIYQYAVDLEDQVLVASTYSVGDGDYATEKRVLDQMMDSVEVT